MKYMKLSEYAKRKNVTYKTAHNRFKRGEIGGAFKDETGHILIPDIPIEDTRINDVILYSRVSTNKQKGDLLRQQKRLEDYSSTKGYNVIGNFKEIASGMNDNRKKLNKILERNDFAVLIVDHKDRLTRFGFNYIENLLNQKGIKIEVINKATTEQNDILHDLVSIIHSFSARMYGIRRKKTSQQIIDFIES